ncbi:hypothetical protein [Streptomyces sp. JB150]|uniref:hypothetical protein n=1 Tax=Streptomyces sp. JB150 TaxID=2714844 RepID=UPI00140D69B6|nr:hypothetical protein [Streptomyces sp. JB150]QIJ64893.1 hypothetical protein G7Z13_24870 [Streptomyces sp. JB150]
MNVLVCAACGRPPTEPARLLPRPSGRPAYDGPPNTDGSRHAPPAVPRVAHAGRPEGRGIREAGRPGRTRTARCRDARGRAAAGTPAGACPRPGRHRFQPDAVRVEAAP